VADRRGKLAAAWVFGILLGSYAYFWHDRDWNSASRLMLTYSLGDRGTIAINGLERQTGDKAFYRGHYYTDKGPGYSLLALPAYLTLRAAGMPPHPLNRDGFRYWAADYWATLATSGVLTAAAGALLTLLAGRLGCGPRRAALVGLAYGLGTPAQVYATLAYGHQPSAAFLLGSCALLFFAGAPRRGGLRGLAAGALAAGAAVNDLSVGPLAAVLGLGALGRVAAGRESSRLVVGFALGAAGPTLVLLGYNALAFGSPFDIGYAHHAFPRFRELHGTGNPLGLGSPRWELLIPLLFGRFRGLAFYAPIVALAPPGWWALGRGGRAGVAGVGLASCGLMLLVNLSYPEWTGGLATGPRLLLPALPFAMLAVAAALGRFGRWATASALGLAALGAGLMLAFQAVGGRMPDEAAGARVDDPLVQVAWPRWRGDPVPGDRFERNLAALAWPGLGDDRVVPPGLQWVQFAPLVAFQVAAIGLMLAAVRPRAPVRPPTA
jgi:hypothetical protein